MQEDKNLKQILIKFAGEDTSADFTNRVMKEVETAASQKQNISFLKRRPLQIVLFLFGSICLLLLIACDFTQPFELPFRFALQLSQSYYLQAIDFLIIFWMVMLANRLWSRRQLS